MKLELFLKQYCPYSVEVRNFIEENGLKPKIQYLDIVEDEKAHDRLVEMNGNEQVPCLVINGNPLLESDDIIDWLGKNLMKAA